MNIEPEEFRCPQCAGTLTAGTDSLHCVQCNATYRIENGILDLRCSRQQYYFNPLSKSEMEKLIGQLTPDHWPATIRAFIERAKNPKAILDNLVIDGRYAWKVFLNLTPKTVMLDFGCGLGNLTKNLAPHVAKVYAMDLTYTRLEFARKRFSIFNPNNKITLLAGGDSTFLPFPQNSIDCVIMSGVLEWVGEAEESFTKGTKLSRLWRMLYWHFGKHSPRAVQLGVLKELRRVLKDDGQLFIAIENRLNHEYFKGRPDHHSGLKYGSLMPRLLANLYSIARKRTPYRTYTYSFIGYKRLLRQAGFANVEVYGLSKGYSHLEEIIPLETMSSWHPQRPGSFKERLKRNRYLVPAYGLLASAAAKPWPRLQDRLFAQLSNQLEEKLGSASLKALEYLVSDKDKLHIKSTWGKQNIIIKIPLNHSAIFSEQQNANILECMQGSAKISSIRSPVPWARGETGGLHYFAEERLTGTPLRNVLLKRGRTALLPVISELLDELNPGPPVVHTLSGDLYDIQVTRRLENLFRVVEDASVRETLLAYFRERLYGIEVSVGLTHGDFSLSNILTNDSRVSGLIDWEAGSLEGLPIIDAISYLESVHYLFHPGDRIAQSTPLLASGMWNVAEEWLFLKERYAACRIDIANHDALVYLNWLHRVTFRLRFSLIYDPFAIDAYIIRVVNKLIQDRIQKSASVKLTYPQAHA